MLVNHHKNHFMLIDFSHVMGFENVEQRIEDLSKNSNKLKISYLNFQNSSQHQNTETAVENLHKFFDQNLKHLIMDRVKRNIKCLFVYKYIG